MYYAKQLGNFLLDPTSIFSRPAPEVDPTLMEKAKDLAWEYKEEAGMAVTAGAAVVGAYYYGSAIAKRLPLIGRAFQEQLVKLDEQLQAKVEADLQGFEKAAVDLIKGITLQDVLAVVVKTNKGAAENFGKKLNAENFADVMSAFIDAAAGTKKGRVNKSDLTKDALAMEVALFAGQEYKPAAKAKADSTVPKAKLK